MPAPAAASRNPTYNRGLGAVLGGWVNIEIRTFTSGAPPNTIGITYAGRPPDLKAQMMHTAPKAPRAPPTPAQSEPAMLNPPMPPADVERLATGTRMPIKKYATPTHSR